MKVMTRLGDQGRDLLFAGNHPERLDHMVLNAIIALSRRMGSNAPFRIAALANRAALRADDDLAIQDYTLAIQGMEREHTELLQGSCLAFMSTFHCVKLLQKVGREAEALALCSRMVPKVGRYIERQR